MRIIAGSFRGRRLKGPKGTNLRPTSDRLRETLFNILGAALGDAVFLDVFAGTGAVGLEALSRGARQAVFIESSPEGNRLIRENLMLCGVAGGYRRIDSDVFTALRALARERFRADVTFLDPPYRWQPWEDLIGTLFRAGLAGAGTTVVLEHHRKAAVPASGPGFRRVRTVEQGEEWLSFFELGTQP